MWRFGGLAHFLDQFREKFRDNVVRREAIGILCFEIFLANKSALVNVEKPRMRHPLVHTLRFGIKNIKVADDPRIGIGQQGKLDLVAFGKVHEDRLTVVANRGQLEALLLECRLGVLQLHELRFAKRSPVRGTEEKDDRPFGAF